MTGTQSDRAIVTPRQWTAPLPLEELFGRLRPLEVDIGCGKGRFLTSQAVKRPEHDFLGIDRLLARLRRVDRKIGRKELANVRLLRIEASYAVERLLPEGSVTAFFVLFPDPWPKRRHRRRRLFCGPFLDAVHRALTPGGRLYAATDHLDYFEQIRGLLTGDARFREIEPFLPEEDERTEFETLFLAKNTPIGRCGFEKTRS